MEEEGRVGFVPPLSLLKAYFFLLLPSFQKTNISDK
jgi:hypothetical protein